MDKFTEVLVIINSVFLIIFLIVGIILMIRLTFLIKSVNLITTKLEEVAESAGKIGVMLENISSGVVFSRMFKNIYSSIFKKN